MSEFGRLLQQYRKRTRAKQGGGVLTQKQFMELLERVDSRIILSYQMVSYWETGDRNRKIQAEDRHILMAIIQVLYENEGIKTVKGANKLLRAGYYSGLDSAEIDQIGFVEVSSKGESANLSEAKPRRTAPQINFSGTFIGTNISTDEGDIHDTSTKISGIRRENTHPTIPGSKIC